MASCPLTGKSCPQQNGKKGCEWWVDVPIETESGGADIESMCVQVAIYRLSITQVQHTDGVHAAVVVQGESHRKASEKLATGIVQVVAGLPINGQEKLIAPESTN